MGGDQSRCFSGKMEQPAVFDEENKKKGARGISKKELPPSTTESKDRL